MTIAATLTQYAAARETWDVAVVGAGPAGAMAARELARRKVRVLLLDRRAFPRPKVCGACLNRRAVSWLETAGLTNLLPDLNAVPVSRFYVAVKEKQLSLNLPGGFAVSRDAFDAALVRAAIDAGADFFPRTHAVLQPGGSNARTVALHSESDSNDGSDKHDGDVILASASNSDFVTARVVLIADGLGNSTLSQVDEFPSRVAKRSRIGLGARIEDSTAEFPAGTICMGVGRTGYVGAVRVEDGSLNVAAAVDPQSLHGTSPARLVESILTESGLPRIPGLSASDWHGTIPLTRRCLRPAGRRVFILGDAAGYVEPFTGEGIAWALGSGFAVAPLAARGVNEWSDDLERDWLRTHRRLVRNRQFWCRGLAAVLRRPRLARLILQVVATLPAVCGPIIRGVNRPVESTEVSGK